MSLDIRIEKNAAPKPKPDMNNLGFGHYFTDHMLMVDYREGIGWHDARIIPYQNISLDPAANVLHYGTEIFEGLKAYRRPDGGIQLFRPEQNFQRMNQSADRLCMPRLDIDKAIETLKELIRIDAQWVPSLPGTSLYIRPLMIASQPFLGVHQSQCYQYLVILSPVAAYYKEGMNPVKIFVEPEYVRAAKGGTGFTKCGGNYAASLIAQVEANRKGYTQVLWLDGAERKYIEEVGTMNVMFDIDGEIVTPALDGSILPGITRMSCIELLRSWGIPVSERKISIQELFAAGESGKLREAFGTGTAAIISPIGELNYDEKNMTISGGKIGPIAQRLYDTLTGIQWGTMEDFMGWTSPID
jgi:branched-chain amino acid aminotransferase